MGQAGMNRMGSNHPYRIKKRIDNTNGEIGQWAKANHQGEQTGETDERLIESSLRPVSPKMGRGEHETRYSKRKMTKQPTGVTANLGRGEWAPGQPTDERGSKRGLTTSPLRPPEQGPPQSQESQAKKRMNARAESTPPGWVRGFVVCGRLFRTRSEWLEMAKPRVGSGLATKWRLLGLIPKQRPTTAPQNKAKNNRKKQTLR